MPVSDRSKPLNLLKSNEDSRFDYPEVFVLLLTVALIALYFEFDPASMALFVVICLPSLMILIYNYRRQASFWTSSIVVMLLSIIIGTMQFCIVLSLSLILLIGLRIIISEAENRLSLIILSVVSIVMFYYVSMTLNGTELNCNEGFLPPTILLASMVTILW